MLLLTIKLSFLLRTPQQTRNAFQWARQPQKLPLTVGISTPCSRWRYMILWAHMIQPPKRHFNRFSRFCTLHPCDQQTDRQDRHNATCDIYNKAALGACDEA